MSRNFTALIDEAGFGLLHTVSFYREPDMVPAMCLILDLFEHPIA